MLLDPVIQIKTTPGALSTTVPKSPGNITLPRWRSDKQALYYCLDGVEYRVLPFIEYQSILTPIINASTIPLAVPAGINPQEQVRSLDLFVKNKVAQLGYVPDEEVRAVRGFALEVTPTQILANIHNSGVQIIRKDGNRGESACNVARWDLIVRGLFYLTN